MSSQTTTRTRSPDEIEEATSVVRRQDIVIITAVVAFALALGSIGYYYTTNFSLLDSFYNASLILSGMGPANAVKTVGGRFFASFYALFSGFVFIVIITIFLQRIVAREFD